MIRLHNNGTERFHGWVRRTTDQLLTYAAGETLDGLTIVTGRAVGPGIKTIDVRVDLEPGRGVSFDLAEAAPIDYLLEPLPIDPVAHFGGLTTIGGVPMDVVAIQPDGAAWLVTLRVRVGPMLCAHVWLLIYPGQPWCTGELLVVASNTAVPDMSATVGDGFDLRIGDALVAPVGGGFHRMLPAGTVLADGQGKAMPFVALWLRHVTSLDEILSAIAAQRLAVGGHGVASLTSTGGPLLMPSGSGAQWARQRWAEAVRRLHTWDPPVCGPAPISGSAGEQEDSLLHAGGEAFAPLGEGAEWVRYLSAIKLHAERPCNHLEANGNWLDPFGHPQLVFWDGRPHWHIGVSPDRLGKPRNLTAEEAHGRWGPDVQHFYHRTLFAAATLTGSPLCQQLLRNVATVYLLQRTSHPALATSAWESARELGCEAQFVADCWLYLEDRVMAGRVVARWRERVDRIILPRMVGHDLFVTWTNDPRVNPTGDGAQWWQESFASWALDECGRVFEVPAVRDLAQRVARLVLDVAWTWTGDHWRAQPQGPIDGSANDQNPAGDSFNHYGMPLCVATVLRADPAHEKARAIWRQLLASTDEKARRWMPYWREIGDEDDGS